MTLAGNQGLLDRLVAEHLPDALRFAMRLTGSQATAEEVVQEALCRAARGIGLFRGQAQFRTWFYRIVVTAFHDLSQASTKQRCSGELTDDLADPRSDNPLEAAMAGELRDLVAQRIFALPIRQREVLLLTVYEQMKPREVAKVLGISESNVYTNLHYARNKLRDELEPYLSTK